MIIPPKTEHL